MKRYAFLVLVFTILLSGCVFGEPEYTLPPSVYTPADFQQQGEYLTCTAGQTQMGIDVSSHQGEIDWASVAEAGVSFAFVRLGYRGYVSGDLHTDDYALYNLEQARKAGLKIGAYFFSQAISVEEAREEAVYALEILGDTPLDLPMVFDWEYVHDTARTAQMERQGVTDCTVAFCEAVRDGGYTPMVYANTDQILRRLDMEQLQEYPLWLAKYNVEQAFPCKADVWQYTQEGCVPGIGGNVDINLLFTDYGIGALFQG